MKDINPVGRKGHEISDRVKELMGIMSINESSSPISKYDLKLSKIGPDGNVYAIIRENKKYFIKKAAKKDNLVLEDFQYIGGLKNKTDEVYPTYSNAIKHLNLKFNSICEALNIVNTINVFENDNIVNERGIVGFSDMKNGFAKQEEETAEDTKEIKEDEDVELSETEKAVESMLTPEEKKTKPVNEAKGLSILRAIENMDEIIDDLSSVKKKILRVNEDVKYKLKLDAKNNQAPVSEPTQQPSAQPQQQSSSKNDKPFDDTPFDAGVEADEDTDPRKFIEQLSGKLGQSLRKYTETKGSPDFDLEKFAVNSVISATHTSKMDANDQKDIIKKVKTAGNTSDAPKEDDLSDTDNVDTELPADDTDSVEEQILEKKDTNFLQKPKKLSIFAPEGSEEAKFDQEINETLKQEEDMNEPAVQPVVKPSPTETPAKPLRRDKPFLPRPSVNPDPKAKK